MDLQNNPPGDYGRFEQIVSQFLLKSLHIILDSRIPSFRSKGHGGSLLSGAKKSDKWFNLVLGDRPAALDSLNFWHRNLMEPMIIDIILVQESSNPLSEQAACTTSGYGTLVETVIERWVIQYEHLRTITPVIGEAYYKKPYKKAIILLRSLCSMMRLLPAYRAFRKLCLSAKACDFDVNYKVSTFSAPFSREEEGMMKQYNFVPVEIQQGFISVSVKYRESLADFNLETSALFPPQIITDYVGSPLTDPLRAFPSSEKGTCAISFPMRGLQSPTSTPFQRPHSWTSGLHRGVPFVRNQPLSRSPPTHRSSTTRYDLSSSPTDIYGQRIQNHMLPNHHRGTSFDDHQISPPFSPSPSPSPPTYLSSGYYMQSRLRSETAPVSIPHPMMARSPRYLSPNFSDPSRHSLPPPSPRSTKHITSSQESPSGIRSLRKTEMSRVGELSSGSTNDYSSQKVSRDSKEDSGRFSGLLSSSGSPRIGFSRSSSRLSLQEDLDDIDFSCPFIVDDIDSPTSNTPGEKQASELSSMSRKSQDAQVGALVHMLRTAPPLRPDSSYYSSHSLKTEIEGEFTTASGFFMPRKTSDALEELKSYKEMKELLLSKSRSRSPLKEDS